MKRNYSLSERDCKDVFAVIKNVKVFELNNYNSKIFDRIGLAIQEEFVYEERPKVVYVSLIDNYKNGILFINIDFTCINNDGEEETREIQLRPIIIY